MEKLGYMVGIAAAVLILLAIVFQFTGVTGAAVAGPTVSMGNIVTLAAIIAIAGIVIVTLLRKYD